MDTCDLIVSWIEDNAPVVFMISLIVVLTLACALMANLIV